MEAVRPSILQRPMRPTSCTKETAEEQFRREQERLAAKGRRHQEHEARLMNTLYPTPEVMQQRHRELDQIRMEQLAAQAAERQRQEQLTAVFAGSRPATAPPASRPWEGASLAYDSVYEERTMRKKIEAQLMEDNRRAALERTLQRARLRQAETEAERGRMAQGPATNFWNLCATPSQPAAHQAPSWDTAAPRQQPQHQPLVAPYSYSVPASPTPPLSGALQPLQTPWALHGHSTAASGVVSLSHSAGKYGSSSSSSSPAAAAAAAPGAAACKYPWEWPGA